MWLIVVAIVIATVIGVVFAVNAMKERSQWEEAIAVSTTEKCLAKELVARYSGITNIGFRGYSYNGMTGATSYYASINGVGTTWRVSGKPGESCSIASFAMDIENLQDSNNGWLAGNRQSGVRLRDKRLDPGKVSLRGVKVTYSLDKRA
ncbi:hypothetical protein [Bifidobacterium catulorum]|uniref:Uncharacterized protein n=1 Tax=Bifidobacterium catulorum TaxID=1630173 RepID=A0A2U2MQZ8_9BIFI|nr:hypothetical protein [Bifidobacterium catulorum]PWG59271.1 hypothetical protein DF200_08530 [Bifidobacterium catulorum]